MSDPTHALELAAPEHAVQRMHPLAASMLAILEHNPDTATMRDLLALQREWEAGEARKAFTVALAALKADLPTVIRRDAIVDYKNKEGVRTHYAHATLAAVMEAVTGPLAAHGFSLGWVPRMTEKGAVEVTCRLVHVQGHAESATLSAPPDASGHKSPAQAIASTTTLLERYTALSLLGIATADMPEPDAPAVPAGAPVDPERNLRAAGAITQAGRTIAEARSKVGGRAVQEWTAADLDVLREWLRGARGPVVVEHGEDDAPDAPPDPTPEEVAVLDAEAAEREAAPAERVTDAQAKVIWSAARAQAKRMNAGDGKRVLREVLSARKLEHTADIPLADVEAVLAEVEAWRP